MTDQDITGAAWTLRKFLSKASHFVDEFTEEELMAMHHEAAATMARLDMLLVLKRQKQARAERPSTPAADCYLTIPRVAEHTGLSVSYIYELGRGGELPIRRMGKARGYRILESDLIKWEASRRKNSVEEEVTQLLKSSSAQAQAV